MTDRRDEPWLFDLDFGDDSEDEPGEDEREAAGEDPRREEEPPPPTLSDFAFGEDEDEPGEPEAVDPEGGDSEGFPFVEQQPLSRDELPLFLDQPPTAAELQAHSQEVESPADPVPPLASESAPSSGPVPVEGPAVEEEEGGVAALRDRALAVLADGLLLVTVLGLCLLGSLAVGGPASPLRHALPFGSFLVVFSFVYSVVSLAFWGQTPGMAIAGVVARAPGDQPLTFGQTGLRWLGGLVTLLLAGLPFLLSLTGRSLADRLSGSETFQA